MEDRDTARLRDDGWSFVCFLAWNPKRAHGWVQGDDLLTWEEGVRLNYLALKASRKAHDTLLQRAKKLAIARVAGRPPPPPPPPPWPPPPPPPPPPVRRT